MKSHQTQSVSHEITPSTECITCNHTRHRVYQMKSHKAQISPHTKFASYRMYWMKSHQTQSSPDTKLIRLTVALNTPLTGLEQRFDECMCLKTYVFEELVAVGRFSMTSSTVWSGWSSRRERRRRKRMQPKRRGVGSAAFLWRCTVLTDTVAKHKHHVTYTHKTCILACTCTTCTAHARMHMGTHTRTCTCTHTHTHTHTYAHAYTLYTYTGNNIQAHCL